MTYIHICTSTHVHKCIYIYVYWYMKDEGTVILSSPLAILWWRRWANNELYVYTSIGDSIWCAISYRHVHIFIHTDLQIIQKRERVGKKTKYIHREKKKEKEIEEKKNQLNNTYCDNTLQRTSCPKLRPLDLWSVGWPWTAGVTTELAGPEFHKRNYWPYKDTALDGGLQASTPE